MHRDKNFIIDNIGNMYFIHPDHPADFPGAGEMLTTNETGAFLWKNLENEITPEKLAERLGQEYEIDIETAKQDTEYFLGSLYQIGALTHEA